MDVLRGRLDVAIPQPTLVEDGLPQFPHGVMVYPKLAGVSPSSPSRALARSAASVLQRIHTTVPDLAVPERTLNDDVVTALVRATKPSLTEVQGRTTERWQADLTSFLAGNPPRSLIHGDFWQANWLGPEDGRTITGLLDFERSGIGLIQEDFAPLTYMGGSFRNAVVDAYCEGSARDPAALLEEARMFDVLRELRGLGWALRNPEAREFDDAMGKVAAVLANY